MTLSLNLPTFDALTQNALQSFFTFSDDKPIFNEYFVEAKAPTLVSTDDSNFSNSICKVIYCCGNAYIDGSTVEKVIVTGNLILINCPNVIEVESETGAVFTHGCPKLSRIKAEKSIEYHAQKDSVSMNVDTNGNLTILHSHDCDTTFMRGVKIVESHILSAPFTTLVIDADYAAKKIIFKDGDENTFSI